MVVNRLFGLDLLRALAIAFVFSGHGMSHYFPNASDAIRTVFLFPDGVALFFCLSGYLIGTSFLHHISAPGKASFLHFWCRRAIRTIPPYIVAISLYNILVVALMAPDFSVSSNSSYVFLQNVAWPIYEGYPESWSLSVEEWFYALLMLLTALAVAARRAEKCKIQDLAFVALVLIAISLFYRAFFLAGWAPHDVGPQDPNWVWENYVVKTVLGRLDAPGFGVLAAIIAFRYPNLWRSRTVTLGCLAAGIFLILAMHQSYCKYPMLIMYFSGPVISLGFALLLPFFAQWTTEKVSFLRGMVSGLAARAFSVYLWHYSIVMLLLAPAIGKATGFPPNLYWVLYLAIGLGGAQAFYVLVERPFVQMKDTVNYVFSQRAFNPLLPNTPSVASSREIAVTPRAARLSWRPLLLMVILPTTYAISLLIDSYLQHAATAAVTEKYAASEVRAGGACDIDPPKKGDRGTLITGWAALPTQHTVAEAIFLDLDDLSANRRIQTQRHQRADVAEHFKDNAFLMSGFNAVLEHEAGTKVKVLQAQNGILYQCPFELSLR
jgi:peptidoglycan/LPS O-acetylase OafA/YrhL